MRKIAKLVALLTVALALVLAQAAVAEPSEALQGVYDALVAEGSQWNQMKQMYADYLPDATYAETVDGSGITLAISNTDYMDGSWTFTQDGDYLTADFAADDMSGAAMTIYVAQAVGDYLGMDSALVVPYINGLSTSGITNDYVRITQDDSGSHISLYIAGPWDMKELDEMAMTAENALYYDPLTEEDTSCGGSIGKMLLVGNGNVDDFTILLGEYGGLDDLAFQSLINAVNVFQPAGYEDFIANYTELADAEAEGYTVRLNADEAAVTEIYEGANMDYSFAIIHFGK